MKYTPVLHDNYEQTNKALKLIASILCCQIVNYGSVCLGFAQFVAIYALHLLSKKQQADRFYTVFTKSIISTATPGD